LPLFASRDCCTTVLVPDYDTIVSSVAAGTQTFETAVLTEGHWVFGIRTDDGTNRELNTSILVETRLDSALALVQSYPNKPFIQAGVSVAGKALLNAYVFPNLAGGEATKVKFYTNDGAGGAVDYATAISPGFVNLRKHTSIWLGQLLTPVFGETARIFGCIAFTSGDVESLRADEVTITPDATLPPAPLTPATITGRE